MNKYVRLVGVIYFVLASLAAVGLSVSADIENNGFIREVPGATIVHELDIKRDLKLLPY